MTPTWIKWLWIGLILIIVIPLVLKNNNPKWVVEKTIVVNFTGEYEKVINFAKGKGLSFEGSSEPYCVMAKNGQEFCGRKEEDISFKLPKGHQNTELKFKSSNGENGSVTVVIWTKK